MKTVNIRFLKSTRRKRLGKPDLHKIIFDNGFWEKNTKMIADVTVPYCLKAVNGNVDTGDWITNDIVRYFEMINTDSDIINKSFYCFAETDIYKTVEACAYLISQGDRRTESECDRIIDILEEAQEDSGYLILYFQTKMCDKKLKNLHECHELYTLGHMIEAAVAYFEATGKSKFLKVAVKFTDCIGKLLEPTNSKKILAGAFDAHAEIELALYRLYKCTENRKYLKLAQIILENRAKDPLYFGKEWDRYGDWSYWKGKKERPKHDKYIHSHIPCREMKIGEGHAVRALYLYTAMADIGYELNDNELLENCISIFDDISKKKMYIHGGIGSNKSGEQEEISDEEYDLPNYAYAETCAAVGMMVFCNRMFEIYHDNRYMNVFEQILYNNSLAAISQSGDKFFYANTIQSDSGFGVKVTGLIIKIGECYGRDWHAVLLILQDSMPL